MMCVLPWMMRDGTSLQAGRDCNFFQPHTDSYGEGGKHVKTLKTKKQHLYSQKRRKIHPQRAVSSVFNHKTLAPVSSREQAWLSSADDAVRIPDVLLIPHPPDVSEIASA